MLKSRRYVISKTRGVMTLKKRRRVVITFNKYELMALEDVLDKLLDSFDFQADYPKLFEAMDMLWCRLVSVGRAECGLYS